MEIHTPQIWYNTSPEARPGWVIRGHSFNVTCSTQPQYPGGSFQLRLIRPNGTVRHSLPALAPSVTFTFSNAQFNNEGYYCCLYKVQTEERTFISRETQPLPISIRGELCAQIDLGCLKCSRLTSHIIVSFNLKGILQVIDPSESMYRKII